MLSGFFLVVMMSGQSLGQVQEGKTANTLDRVNSTISKAASEHQQSPLPRMIAFDLAFASTEGEADALKDNAVLLVTMITQMEKERPIKEALVVRDSQKYKLVNLNSF